MQKIANLLIFVLSQFCTNTIKSLSLLQNLMGFPLQFMEMGYRIVGILCEVLICAGYASCRGSHTLILYDYSVHLSLMICTCHSSILVTTNTKRDTKYILVDVVSSQSL